MDYNFFYKIYKKNPSRRWKLFW